MARVPLDVFAAQLFAAAASPERIAAAAATVIENPMPVGPVRVGPGGIGSASAICYIGEIVGRADTGDEWDAVLEVPIRVGANVRVRPQRFKFAVEITVEVRLRLVPTTGLTITIEVDEITASDVTTKIDAQHLPAKLVSLGYNIESEVIERVLEHANELLDSPPIRKARHVNIAEVIDRAWEFGAIMPDTRPKPPPLGEVEPPALDDEPELDERADSSNADGWEQPQRTLPLELPQDRPHTY